jgi:hypothetical protein
MATAPPPARQRFNPRGRAAALPSSYTTTWDTTRVELRYPPRPVGLDGTLTFPDPAAKQARPDRFCCLQVGFQCKLMA